MYDNCVIFQKGEERTEKSGFNKRKLGANKEELAAQYLEKQGVRILERNFRSHQGEIDLVAKHGECLVFVEVKYRRDAQRGTPQEAVGFPKQKKICRVADFYRLKHGIGSLTSIRYDVVAIEGDQIDWIPNAFPHVYSYG